MNTLTETFGSKHRSNAVMKFSVLTLTAALVAACGAQDKPRTTTNSTNLTGLWRMNLQTTADQLNSTLGFSYTLVDNGTSLVMVPCAGKIAETLRRSGQVIGPVIAGDAGVVNNDTLNVENDFGRGTGTKMAATAAFDMGSLNFQSTALGNLTTKDLCSNTISAKYLGVSALETVTVYTRHASKPFVIELSKVGTFGATTYSIGTDVSKVSVALESDLLMSRYKDTRVNLPKGELIITKSSNVWLNGEIKAQLPDGTPFTAQFEFEKP